MPHRSGSHGMGSPPSWVQGKGSPLPPPFKVMGRGLPSPPLGSMGSLPPTIGVYGVSICSITIGVCGLGSHHYLYLWDGGLPPPTTIGVCGVSFPHHWGLWVPLPSSPPLGSVGSLPPTIEVYGFPFPPPSPLGSMGSPSLPQWGLPPPPMRSMGSLPPPVGSMGSPFLLHH